MLKYIVVSHKRFGTVPLESYNNIIYFVIQLRKQDKKTVFLACTLGTQAWMYACKKGTVISTSYLLSEFQMSEYTVHGQLIL